MTNTRDPNTREVPMATVLGIAWVAFAVGLFVAAVIAVAARPEITVVAVPPTTKAVVETASAATTTREPVTTAKPTTTTTEPPPTTRYIPPTTRYIPPPTISQSTDEAVQRAALEAAWADSDMDLCVAVDGLGMDAALDAFMEGSDGEFDRWLVEEFFADKCGY